MTPAERIAEIERRAGESSVPAPTIQVVQGGFCDQPVQHDTGIAVLDAPPITEPVKLPSDPLLEFQATYTPDLISVRRAVEGIKPQPFKPVMSDRNVLDSLDRAAKSDKWLVWVTFVEGDKLIVNRHINSRFPPGDVRIAIDLINKEAAATEAAAREAWYKIQAAVEPAGVEETKE